MFSFNTPLAGSGDQSYFALGAIPGIDGQARAYTSVASLLASPPALGAAALQAAGLPPASSASGLSPRLSGQGLMGDHLSHFKPFGSPGASRPKGAGAAPRLETTGQKSGPGSQNGGDSVADGGGASSQVTVKQERAQGAAIFSTSSPSSAASMLLMAEGSGSPLDGVHCLVTPVRTQQQAQAPQQEKQPSQGPNIKITIKRAAKTEGDAMPPPQKDGEGRIGAAISLDLISSDAGGVPPASVEGFGSLIAPSISQSSPSRHHGEPVGQLQDSGVATWQYLSDLAVQQQQTASSLAKHEAYSYMVNRQRICFPGEETASHQNLQHQVTALFKPPTGHDGSPRAPSGAASAPSFSEPGCAAAAAGMLMYADMCGGIDATTPLYKWDELLPGNAFCLSPSARNSLVRISNHALFIKPTTLFHCNALYEEAFNVFQNASMNSLPPLILAVWQPTSPECPAALASYIAAGWRGQSQGRALARQGSAAAASGCCRGGWRHPHVGRRHRRWWRSAGKPLELCGSSDQVVPSTDKNPI